MKQALFVPCAIRPLSTVKIGRFTTNIRKPEDDNHDPSWTQPPVPAVMRVSGYAEQADTKRQEGLKLAITSFLSMDFSRRMHKQVRVGAERVEMRMLDNSEHWFEKATALEDTRVWIERAIDKGRPIYMIVGFVAVTKGDIEIESLKEKGVETEVTAPAGLSLAAAGAVLPLGDALDLSAGVRRRDHDGRYKAFAFQDEQVCAFQYRRVSFKWLSSRSLASSKLSSSRWLSLESPRGDDDEDEDTIEVDSKPLDLDNLEGEWQASELPEGLVFVSEIDDGVQEQ